MLRVFIDELEFYAYHGVPDAEQEIGHRYIVSVVLTLESEATATDRVGDTVDYGAVGTLIERTAKAARYRTLERLAQVLGEAILGAFPRVSKVDLHLAKRLPPAPMHAERAGVELTVTR